MEMGITFNNNLHGSSAERVLEFDDTSKAHISKEEASAIKDELCSCGKCKGALGIRGEQSNVFETSTGKHYEVNRRQEDDGSAVVEIVPDKQT